ncbi:hypothetical protein K438DRAFT_1845868 [Mycena galopus ATCC 62051]|nr:hypothetical protein K438DRAFT_1845868 [Mycena galopus ATCC 62051]
MIGCEQRCTDGNLMGMGSGGKPPGDLHVRRSCRRPTNSRSRLDRSGASSQAPSWACRASLHVDVDQTLSASRLCFTLIRIRRSVHQFATMQTSRRQRIPHLGPTIFYTCSSPWGKAPLSIVALQARDPPISSAKWFIVPPVRPTPPPSRFSSSRPGPYVVPTRPCPRTRRGDQSHPASARLIHLQAMVSCASSQFHPQDPKIRRRHGHGHRVLWHGQVLSPPYH